MSGASADPEFTPKIFLGMDGGGTRTRAALVGADGAIFGVGLAGPSNPNFTPVQTLCQNVGMAVERAWTAAGTPPRAVDAAFLGIAGARSFGCDSLRQILAPTLALSANGLIAVDSDLRTALCGALHLDQGIVVIAGTGSSCYGRDAEGKEARAGGWGPLIGDEGSGYWLAMEGFRAVSRAADGRGAYTSLTSQAKQFTGLSDLTGLSAFVAAPKQARDEIARFARHVVEAAEVGDTVAAEVLRRGAEELAMMANAAAAQLSGGVRLPVALTGGLSQNRHYRTLVRTALEARQLTLVESKSSPLVGAVILAARLCGETISPRIAERIQIAEAETNAM